MRMRLLLVVLMLTVISQPAYAYIGPGLGAGLIATVFGVLGAIVLAFIGIVYYPIKRLIRSLRSRRASHDDERL